ncbi:MAG TPA: IPT/TIG domain-containing protein [Fodinibius sp.]|nr:IPT/TIG domain-containing protein [Fodinibius sp.]
MKKVNIYIKNLAGVMVAILVLVAMASCEDDPAGVREASGPPQLDRVSLVDKDSTTTEGQRGVQYVIWGDNLAATRSVTFNGAEANINPALATEQNLIVTVPVEAPYANAPDSIVVTNPKGSASLSFRIQQPPPIIDSFTPAAASAGNIVTITGTIFDDVESVFFGNTEAEIVSSSPTEIQVRVPEGVVQAKITVLTPGGETVSEKSFGFKYVIYDDSINSNFWVGGWSGTTTLDNTSIVKRGSNSIEQAYSGGWGGFQIGMNSPLDLSDYTTVKLSIYGGENASKVKIYLSGNGDAGKTFTLETGKWVDFTIPLSELGSPSVLSEFVIQEATGSAPVTIYIDDIGLI